MKRESRSWNFVIPAIALLSALPAHAGRDIGNGGGAWVCRETSGKIRWAELVDRFELGSEWGLTPAPFPGDSYKRIADQIQGRLLVTDLGLHNAIYPYLQELNYLLESPSHVQYTADTLQVIDDALWRLTPNTGKCLGGVLGVDPQSGQKRIPYEQVINYQDDGRILVQSELFGKLSEVSKAAAIFHEAIYAYRREHARDQNSIFARRMVALLFSDISVEALRAEFMKIGAIAPPAPVPVLPPVQELPRYVNGQNIDPSSQPGKLICQTRYINPNGYPITGVCALVSRNIVLTTAGSLSRKPNGDNPSNLTVSFLAADGSGKEVQIQVRKIWIPACYDSTGSDECNMAALLLSDPVGDQRGWFGLSVVNPQQELFPLNTAMMAPDVHYRSSQGLEFDWHMRSGYFAHLVGSSQASVLNLAKGSGSAFGAPVLLNQDFKNGKTPNISGLLLSFPLLEEPNNPTKEFAHIQLLTKPMVDQILAWTKYADSLP